VLAVRNRQPPARPVTGSGQSTRYEIRDVTGSGQSTRYEIREASGALVAVHCRQDGPADKRMWWERPDGTKGLGGLPLADLPLYGIDRLGDWPDPMVVIVEGEKAAGALVAAGVPALGTVTGAAACPGRASLAELTGRQVVLWPDNDEPGRRHMQRGGVGLAGIAEFVSQVAWPDAPDGGDAADYLYPVKSAGELHDMAETVTAGAEPYPPTGHTLDELHALLAGAETVGPATDTATVVPVTDASSGGRRPSQATMMVQLVGENAIELFHDPDGTAFAMLPTADRPDGHDRAGLPDPNDQQHVAIVAVRSAEMQAWLSLRFYAAHRSAADRAGLDGAIGHLEAMARYDGPEYPVFLRVAQHEGALYLDLGERTGRVIEVAASGWRVIDRAPVRFRRSASAGAYPEPARGGSIDDLREFLTAGDEGFRLMVGWTIQALRGSGPYAVGHIGGEHGSAKTTAMKVLRRLADPASALVIARPKDRENLLVAVRHHHVVAIDNVSSLPDWLSDDLALIATGGAFSLRRKYTDLDELAVHACRPILLNGIEEFVTQGDLLDRVWSTDLPVLADAQKRPERDFWPAFERAQPGIFGAILDALVVAIAGVDDVVLAQSTRMVDAARFVTAAEGALGWSAGTFAADLAEMRAGGRESALEASPLTTPLLAMAETGAWSGTADALLDALEARVDERTRGRPNWPRSPRGLGGQLRRLAPELRSRGVGVIFDQREPHTRRRLIAIQHKVGESTVPTVPTVPPSTIWGDRSQQADRSTVPDRPPEGRDGPGDGGDGWGRLGKWQPSPESVRDSGVGDGGDGRFPLFQVGREEREPDAIAGPRARLETDALDGHAEVRLTAGETIDCDDYPKHQSFHRRVVHGWTCDACHPAATA